MRLNQIQMHINQTQMHLNQIQMHLNRMQWYCALLLKFVVNFLNYIIAVPHQLNLPTQPLVVSFLYLVIVRNSGLSTELFPLLFLLPLRVEL